MFDLVEILIILTGSCALLLLLYFLTYKTSYNDAYEKGYKAGYLKGMGDTIAIFTDEKEKEKKNDGV